MKSNEPMLRPDFTRQLAERLLSGEAINLTGAHGLGRRRTLTDLTSLLAGHATVLRADMKFAAGDYQAMLGDLADQAGMETPPDNLAELLERLTSSANPAALILHNFDLLRSQPHDARFDDELLPQLAAIATLPGVGLLAVCEEIHDDWPLPFSNLPLPPLP